MKHYGDITKIKGSCVPLVDIVCGGSPCQDLSVAGKRAGLDGKRSGLFMEQIRIIKEMRDESKRQNGGSDFDIRHIQPRYMVWENVPGAFSSNGGEDFRVVLEETARVVESDTNVPGPEGGWSNAGAIMGHGWSIAWRVHDAQFWGVPQRRKRIALVADFGGSSAPEILFERSGMQRNFEKSRKERERTPVGTNGNNKVTYGFDPNTGSTFGFCWDKELILSLRASQVYAVCIIDEKNTTIRRITPNEEERLQGYPDGWTNIGEWTDTKGKKHKGSDGPRYKALGNSIALPFWEWMAKRMVSHIDHKATMASLFDGIGGFPLVFSRAGCEPVWASEIEEFPIAVTKIRFPEEREDKE